MGLQADRGYFSELPWENVDMVNGAVILKFTDLVLPGNAGMDLRFGRQSINGGWAFGLEGIPMSNGNPDDPLECCDYPVFYGLGIEEKSFPENGTTGSAAVYLTRQFWRYTVATKTLEFPNGWVGTYDVGTGGMLQELHDPFGNSVTFNYGQSSTSITQYLGNGQTRTVTYAPSIGQPTTMTYQDSSGGSTRTWTFQWTGQPSRLTQVSPPAGPAWQFSYTLQQPAPCYQYFPATLGVTMPYGASVQYQFSVQHLPWTSSPPECIAAVSSRSISGTGVPAGTWTFNIPMTYGSSPRFSKTSTVTTPLGRVVSFTHETYHAFGMGMGLSSQFLTRKEVAGAAVVERTPTVLPFVGGLSEPAIARQDITVDGVLHRSDFAYDTGAPFANYHRPHQTTETGSHPSSRVTERTYDYAFGPRILNRVKSETVTVAASSYTTSSEYDNGTGFQIERVTNSVATYVEPDSRGNVWRETGSFVTTFTHTWGKLRDTATPAHTISRAINSDGTLASETRGGHTTSHTYDPVGRPTVVTPAVGDVTDTTYGDSSRTISVCRGSQCSVTEHDALGRPVGATDAAGVTSITQYDTDGRKSFDGYPGGGTGSGDTYSYDALNRVTSVCRPGGACRISVYTANRVTITDENNHATEHRFHAFGDPFDRRLISVLDAAEEEWSYEYTTLGALTRVNAPAGPDRTWTYQSGTHHLLSEYQPESGTTNYDYDAAGILTWKTDAAARAFQYHYDGNKRLIQINGPGTADDVDFEYDASDNRTRVKNALVDSTFVYDGANRLTQRTDVIAGRTFVTAYQYNGRDNVTRIDYPSGRQVTYTPDDQGRVVSVTGSGATFASNVQYHASGAISALTLGNGTTEAVTFDARHRPLHVLSGPLDLTYAYDAVGNVLSVTDGRSAFTSSFEYDGLDRLGWAIGYGARGYAYDALGNRTIKYVATGNVTYYTDPDNQRLMSIAGAPETATLTYDAVGNLTADATGTYAYTAFNLMKTATVGAAVSSYGYDGENQRKKKEAPDGIRYYIHGPGGKIIAEYRETAGGVELVREYIYLGSRLLASAARNETPAPVGRVTGVSASPNGAAAGTSVSVTVTGPAYACSKVEVDFGDGTVTPYTIASPHLLPKVATHTYANAGLYTIVARGQEGASGPCYGAVSAPLEVTSGDVIENGDFTEGTENGLPAGWGISSAGGALIWDIANGLNFYRPEGSTSGVVLQYTGMALPTGAPMEATFTLGNSDTVRKRVSVMVHNAAFDDLSLCTFWLDPGQSPASYAMRTHTTKAWTDATISFYAADANGGSSTGAYQLNHVTLTYRPALNSAKTDCVDPLRPTSGGVDGSNLLANGDFGSGSNSWSLTGQMTSQTSNGKLQFYRTSGTPAPIIAQATGSSVSQDQRLSAVFELGNTSSTRQRVTVTVQEASGTDFTNCVFWLAPNTPKRAFAITTYAAQAWTSATIAVAPATAGASGTHSWLEFDTVSLQKTTQATLGTECYEPGSFTLQGGAPAPEPAPLASELTSDTSIGGARFAFESGGPSISGTVGAPANRNPLSVVNDLQFGADGADGERLLLDAGAPGTAREVPPAPIAVAMTVTITGTGSGSVSSSPAGLTCGGQAVNCTGWFAEGATVTLTAIADSGMTFAGWTGAGCSGTGTCVVAMLGAQPVTALFSGPVVTTFYHVDSLGSVRAITDASGATLSRRDYFAFGEESSSLTGDPRRFTGKEIDPETAMQYFGARYYRNESGRFTTVDPHNILTEAESDEELLNFLGNPQGWNRYSYVRNRSLVLTDPDGRCPVCLGFAAAAVIQRFGPPALSALQNWAVRLLGSPTAREIVVTVVETATGYGGPSSTAAAAKGVTVIGSYPGYLDLADELNAKRFSVPIEIWNRLSAAERVAANTKFLDRLIKRKDTVKLNMSVADALAKGGAGLKFELEYLLNNGYAPGADGWSLVYVGK